MIESHEWQHVNSEDNPTNAIFWIITSCNSCEIVYGPPLIKKESDWPSQIMQSIEILELKANTYMITTFKDFEAILERYSCRNSNF